MSNEELVKKLQETAQYIKNPWCAENLCLMEEVMPACIKTIQRPVEDNDIPQLLFRMSIINSYAALIENLINFSAEEVQRSSSAITKYPVSEALQYIRNAGECLHSLITADSPVKYKLSSKNIRDLNYFELYHLFILIRQDICMGKLLERMAAESWIATEDSIRSFYDGKFLAQAAEDDQVKWNENVNQMSPETAENLVNGCSQVVNAPETKTLQEIKNLLPITYWMPDTLKRHLISYVNKELELRERQYEQITHTNTSGVLVQGIIKLFCTVVIYTCLYNFVHSDMLVYLLTHYVYHLIGSIESNVKVCQYAYYAALIWYMYRVYRKYMVLKSTQKLNNQANSFKLFLGSLPWF